MSENDKEQDGSRRRVILNLALAGTAVGVGGQAMYPAVRFLSSPAGEGRRGDRVVVCKRNELRPGSAKMARLGTLPVLVVAGPDGELSAFVARCTHLGCVLQYRPDAGQIACACHSGRFGLDGRVVAGPPPSPLRPVQVTLRGDDVVVERG